MVLPPPTLRMKCRLLKIGKCIWSRCHVITLPKLQNDWINVGVVYNWKSTQVTNNHVREFRSMPLPNKTLCSNLVTLMWLVVPIWNPIAPFFFLGLVHRKWLKHDCRNPTLAKCGGEAQHSQSWGLRMFKVQQQGPKHLTLRCLWCHWKVLKA
jgi:hypothetical protein